MTTLIILIAISVAYAIGLIIVCRHYPELLKNDNNDPPYPPGY